MKYLIILSIIFSGCSENRVVESHVSSVAPIVRDNIDQIIGIYNIEVCWVTVLDLGPRNWRGEVHIEKGKDGNYTGIMRLKCCTMNWVVEQDIAVTIDNDVLIIQGSNVKEIEVPDGRGGYGWDVFKMKRQDKVWISGEAAGEHEGNGTVKMFKNDVASNESVRGARDLWSWLRFI